MITRAIDWIKSHRLTALLLLVVLYFTWKSFFGGFYGLNSISLEKSVGRGSFGTTSIANPSVALDSYGSDMDGKSFSPIYPPTPEFSPQGGISNRMVVQNSSLSILVSNVVEARNKILDYTKQVGGYMVQSDTSNPQEEATASITVRVPSARLDEVLSFYRSQGVKVVSENLMGTDVTDQFVDIDARIETLTKTKILMDDLLDQAVQITDLTNLTREVLSIQSQIDALKGQQESLKSNADFTRVTMYLSTDEIALPYTPNETFRPGVIVKLAVRSLISHLRQFATTFIWLVVYAVIWVPMLVVIYLVNKRLQRKATT